MRSRLSGGVAVAASASALFGLALTLPAGAQGAAANEAECRKIWSQADSGDQGYLTGSQADTFRQAMARVGPNRPAGGIMGEPGGASGGAGGGRAAGATAGAGDERLMRSEFLAACMQNPEPFRNVKG